MDTLNELCNIFYSENVQKLSRKKALCIMMKEAEVDIKIIAKVTGASVRRIYEYSKQYKETGIESITKDLRYKPVSDLAQYKDEIKEEFTNNPPATSNEASEKIKEMYGIKRSPTQIRKLMNDIGMKPRKVGHIPAKANPEKQREFLEKELEPRLEEAKKGKRAVLFLDAAHMVWQVYLGMLWCFSRIFIQASSGRVRINILGAYDPIRNELIQIKNYTYITSVTICEMLDKLKKQYLEMPITIVLDNARYQKCELVMKKAKELEIELLYLPTYSPNLNLIERLWRFVKKDCLYSKYYETSSEFEQAISKSLDSISTEKKDKIKKLMNLKFQMFDKETVLKSA